MLEKRLGNSHPELCDWPLLHKLAEPSQDAVPKTVQLSLNSTAECYYPIATRKA